MLGFIEKITFFKWNWQKQQKLTIEAVMTSEELKKFLDHNKIALEQNMSPISSMRIIVTVK